jgi:small subunit ribosomal protein S4
MGPRFKVARRLGVNVFGHPKALKRGIKKPHSNLSEYGKQLVEKQKLKAYYGVMEKQFRRYINKAQKSKDKPGEVLVQNLERRLDNIVYRLGFASTLRQARQMVTHGHMRVNGKKIDIPSYSVSIGEEISLREKSRRNDMFAENFISHMMGVDYLEKNPEAFSGKLVKMPYIDEIPVDVTVSRIIEFYSR